MCKYCKEEVKILKDNMDNIILELVVEEGWMRVISTNTDTGDIYDVIEKIEFCPICGEKLHN